MLRIAITILVTIATCLAQEGDGNAGFIRLCTLISQNKMDEAKALTAPELGQALSGPASSPIIILAKKFVENAKQAKKGPLYNKTKTAQAEIWILKNGVEDGVDLAVSVIHERSLIVGIFKL